MNKSRMRETRLQSFIMKLLHYYYLMVQFRRGQVREIKCILTIHIHIHIHIFTYIYIYIYNSFLHEYILQDKLIKKKLI